MFFYIGEHTSYLNKVHEKLYLDDGWDYINNIWYKGYSTECNISENLDKIVNGYKPKGIWCVIQYTDSYKVFYSDIRGFPEFYFDGNITNIKQEKFQFISNYKPLELKKESSLEQVINNIKDILLENCRNYVRYNNNIINLWCTGGVDSISVIALLEKEKIPYNIYIAKPKKFTGDVRVFENSITEYSSILTEYIKTKYWGYEILSYFDKKITLATGFYGDEFLARGPYQINSLANSLGKTVIDLLNQNHYMFYYIFKAKHKKNYSIELLSEAEAKENILIEAYSEYQMWHLDNISTFCPYYDIEILRETLSLKTETLIESALNASIQKDIIKLCQPDVLLLLDTYKNVDYGRINFMKNIKNVNLKYCSKIIYV